MSRADDIARLLGAQPKLPGCTLLTGTVVSWTPGAFVVRVLGVNLANPPVLGSAGTLKTGDAVAVLRSRSSYLILGAIVPAGG